MNGCRMRSAWARIDLHTPWSALRDILGPRVLLFWLYVASTLCVNALRRMAMIAGREYPVCTPCLSKQQRRHRTNPSLSPLNTYTSVSRTTIKSELKRTFAIRHVTPLSVIRKVHSKERLRTLTVRHGIHERRPKVELRLLTSIPLNIGRHR